MPPEAQAIEPVATPAAPAEVPKVETPTEDAQAEADFGAGFKDAHSEEPSAESRPPVAKVEPTAKPTPAKEVAKPEAAAEPPKVEAEKPVFAGLTETQLKAVLAQAAEVPELRKLIQKTHDTAAGRIGEVQQALKDLKQNPSAQAVKVTKEALKRLNEGGYEEIAELLAADFDGLLVASQAPNFDSAAFEKTVEDKFAKRLDEHNRATERKLLTLAHPTWAKDYASPDFKLWAGTLPDDVRAMVETSWDSVFLGDALTAFKAWKTAGAKEPGKEADPAAATKERQDKRLAAAIAPQGTPSASEQPSDDDLFEAGYKEARRGG